MQHSTNYSLIVIVSKVYLLTSYHCFYSGVLLIWSVHCIRHLSYSNYVHSMYRKYKTMTFIYTISIYANQRAVELFSFCFFRCDSASNTINQSVVNRAHTRILLLLFNFRLPFPCSVWFHSKFSIDGLLNLPLPFPLYD